MSAVIEYYSVLKCKAEENGEACDYEGWCVYCSNLAFNEDHIKLIDDFSAHNFKYN